MVKKEFEYRIWWFSMQTGTGLFQLKAKPFQGESSDDMVFILDDSANV